MSLLLTDLKMLVLGQSEEGEYYEALCGAESIRDVLERSLEEFMVGSFSLSILNVLTIHLKKTGLKNFFLIETEAF